MSAVSGDTRAHMAFTSLRAIRSRWAASLTSLIKQPALTHGSPHNVVKRVAPELIFRWAEEEQVLGNRKGPKGLAQAPQFLPTRAARLLRLHNQQVEVRIRLGVAARARTKEDNPLRLTGGEEGVHHFLKQGTGISRQGLWCRGCDHVDQTSAIPG